MHTTAANAMSLHNSLSEVNKLGSCVENIHSESHDPNTVMITFDFNPLSQPSYTIYSSSNVHYTCTFSSIPYSYLSNKSEGLYEHFEHTKCRLYPDNLNQAAIYPYIYILDISTFLYENTSKHTLSIYKNSYRSVFVLSNTTADLLVLLLIPN